MMAPIMSWASQRGDSQVEPLACAPVPAPWIDGEAAQALADRRDRPLRALDAGELLPAHRDRHRAIRPRTRRVAGDGNRCSVISLVVDEHLAAALTLIEGDRVVLGVLLRERRRDDTRELEHRIPRVLGAKGHHDMQTFPARGLYPA